MVRKLRKHPEEFDKAKNRRNWYEMVKADMPLRIGDEVILEDYCPEGIIVRPHCPFIRGGCCLGRSGRGLNVLKTGWKRTM